MNYSWGFIDGVVKSVARRVSFAPTRYSAGGVSLRPALAQMGAALDYENAAGDVLSNSVVAACVNAICQALPEAPILLEKRVGGNEFEPVYSHPVLDLLHNPNPYLSEAELWGVTTAFERTRGEAFWYFEYDSSHSVPREIWFRAPEYVQVLSDTARFISGYNITSESGTVVSLDEGDVVHFRHQLSTANPRAGWSPIQTGKRQIVGDNGAATYHSAILRNAGAASLIISLKDAAAAGEVTPGQIDEYVQLFKRKVVGEGSGAILGMDLPLDVHKVGFSPDEMALDRLLEYYESRICALMGVNRRVINLGSDPTYENSKVALNDFWERTIVPMRRRHASTLSSQLLPLFGLDPAIYRLRFDFSEVEALRENVDALHARWRATFSAGGIDLFTFQEKIGLKPDESYRGRYAKPSQPLDEGNSGDEVKAWDEAKHPRNELGQFINGAGGHVLRMLGASSAQNPYDYDIIHLEHQHQLAFNHLSGPLREMELRGEVEKARFFAYPLKHVLHSMPSYLMPTIIRNVKETAFFENSKDLSESIDAKEETLGYYNHKTQKLGLDGDGEDDARAVIYAHEMGHVLDGPSKKYSEDPEWQAAYVEEIKGEYLSEYADTNSAEGFCEFSRLLYMDNDMGRKDPDHQKHSYVNAFPKCYAFWKENGLL